MAEQTWQERLLAQPFPCTRVWMCRDDFRDILVWGLVEEGWTEADALREADRRLAEMAEEQSVREDEFCEGLAQVGESLFSQGDG